MIPILEYIVLVYLIVLLGLYVGINTIVTTTCMISQKNDPKRGFIAFFIGVFLIFIFSLLITAPAWAEDPQTLKEQKSQEGYIINLKKLIEKSKNKIDDVNDRLDEQAQRRRNQQREEKAREYYQKAMKLYEDGKYGEAQELWEKAIKITEHPEMKNYVRESVRRTKKQDSALREAEKRRLRRLEIERGFSADEVEAKYDEAVVLFKQKNYLVSQETFETVEDMFPDHKATRSYLMIIGQEIEKDQRGLIEEALKEEAQERAKEKESWRKELKVKENQRIQNLREQAEVVYVEALKLNKLRQYEKAKDKFKEVEWILPNYKDTIKYLARIDKDIAAEQIRSEEEKHFLKEEELDAEQMAKHKTLKQDMKKKAQKEGEQLVRLKDEAKFVYDQALTLYKRKDYPAAKQKFLEVDQMYPDYRKTNKYLRRLNDIVVEEMELKTEGAMQAKIVQAEGMRVERERDFKFFIKEKEYKDKAAHEIRLSEAQVLYTAAKRLYREKLYMPAQEKFLQVYEILPGYKNTYKYLTKINEHIIHEREHMKSPNNLERADKLINAVAAIEQRQLQLPQMYTRAVSLYDQTFYKEAKGEFLEVGKTDWDYKKTFSYLAKSTRFIREEEWTLANNDRGAPDMTSSLSSPKDIGAMPPPEIAITASRIEIPAPVVTDPSDVVQQKTMERHERFEAEAKEKYQEAVALYKRNNFHEAKLKFVQVEALYPNYKDTSVYLSQIDAQMGDSDDQPRKWTKKSKKRKSRVSKRSDPKKKLGMYEKEGLVFNKQSKKKNTKDLYKQAKKLYRQKQYAQAKEKLTLLIKGHPGHRSAINLMKAIDKRVSYDSQRHGVDKDPFKTSEAKTGSFEKIEEKSQNKKEAFYWAKQREKKLYEIKKKEKELKKLKGDAAKEYEAMIKAEYGELKLLDKGRDYWKDFRESSGFEQEANKEFAKEQKTIEKEEKLFLSKAEKERKEIKAMKEQEEELLKEQEEIRKRMEEQQEEARKKEEALKEKIEKISQKITDMQETLSGRIEEKRRVFEEKSIRSLEDAKIAELKNNFSKEKKIEEYKNIQEKARDREKDKLAELEKTKRKMDKRLKDFKEKEEEKWDKEVVGPFKIEIDHLMEQAVVYYKADRRGLVETRFLEIEGKLTNPLINLKYRNNIEKKIARYRQKMDKQYKKEKARAENSDDDNRFSLRKLWRGKDRNQVEEDIEVSQLKKQIEYDEKRIAKKKRRLGEDGILSSTQKKGKDDMTFTSEERMKRHDLEELLEERQKELEREREQVRSAYDEHLKKLYTKALDLRARKLLPQAFKIFQEIEKIQPGYKDTIDLLNELRPEIQNPSPIAEMEIPALDSTVEANMASENKQEFDGLYDQQSRMSLITDALDDLEKGF